MRTLFDLAGAHVQTRQDFASARTSFVRYEPIVHHSE